MSDESILAELGARISRRRLNLEMTQAEVAEQAGISKRTLERMEAGYSSQLSSLLRVLRILDGLQGLEQLLPDSGPRPMELLRGKGRQRQRASGRRASGVKEPSWTWDDDA